ncbi:GNAT family N-acetyltransferase [Phenylobacterium sp. VNQ135]|uniref:GNAT family N-acetyltransferase n=1 Tax=Phenylobacterium sp. VNQ135 TaxID=3400922 RepID=UPI003BFCFAE4
MAVEADLQHLPRIERSAAQAFQGRDVPAFLLTHASPAEAWRPQLEAGTLWVSEADGALLAFLAATADGDRLHIDEVDVDQPAQGRGLGRRLMAHAIGWAMKRGLAQVTLTTFRNVPWNGPFYASLGFMEDDRLPALQEILRAEAEKGLSDRCAMVKPL